MNVQLTSTILALCAIGAVLVLAGVVIVREARRTSVLTWLPGYFRQDKRNRRAATIARRLGETHLLFCMVDHFEPISAGSTRSEERDRMRAWLDRYPKLARRHRDSYGRFPQHTWFYPAENYNPEYLGGLAQLCQQGLGEIEMHLHHGYDTSETLRAKIEKGLLDFSKHGACITQECPPRKCFGFIHGNMALDNSMYDPALCGVNDEITILRDTGCYADFSMPTAPCVSQPKMVNAIYYATDDRLEPKSHETGVQAEVGRAPSGDLLIIAGPLGFNWRRRKWGILPRIDNAEIQDSNPPTADRVRRWMRRHIHIPGRPEWVFVKVSCHGAEERSHEVLLGTPAEEMYNTLELEFRDRAGCRLHYVTARELYNIIKAAEAGEKGDPSLYRDSRIPSYKTHTNWQASPFPLFTHK